MAEDQTHGETYEAGQLPQTDVRVLRRVDIPTGPTGRGSNVVAGIGVVVDVETTGTDRDTDAVIELAVRRFVYDEQHVITRVDRSYSWREDPRRPLSPEIVRITGLTDQELAGHRIDDVEAGRILASADVRIAHNAAFDRPFVERRLPAIAGLPWACSMTDIEWTERGFESSKLGWVLTQCGFFHDPHRAEADVDATIQILQHELQPGMTALQTMLERASAPSWIVRAFGAAYGMKEVLRGRRYRWNALQRVWWKEVHDRVTEEEWLLENVYAMQGGSGSADFEPVDWRSRYE